MAQYQVPQFLEVEDKLFGPLTFKQFLYLGGGIGLGFLAWTLLPSAAAIAVGGPITLFFVALAFLKINDRPFIFVVESMFNYLFSKKLYLWRKTPRDPKKKEESITGGTMITVPKLSDSKLRSLSWELDIHESLEGPDQSPPPRNTGSISDNFKI